MNGPFTYLGTSLDAALNAYVVNSVRTVSGLLAPPLLVALSLSIVTRGLDALRGSRTESIVDAALAIAVQGTFLTLAVSAGLYMATIVAAANSLMDGLPGLFAAGNASGYSALDDLEAQGASIAAHYLALGVTALPTGGYVDCATGAVMACVIGILLMIVGGYFILAKTALALVLAIGPLFVGLRAFEPTAHLFSNWLNKVLNYIILMALMTASVALLTSIYGTYLSHLMTISDETNPLADTLDLAVLSGALLILALQMPRIAAALTSASAVAGSTFWLIVRSGSQQSVSAAASSPAPAQTVGFAPDQRAISAFRENR